MGRRLEADLVMPREGKAPVERGDARVTRAPRLVWLLLPTFLAALPVLLALFGGRR